MKYFELSTRLLRTFLLLAVVLVPAHVAWGVNNVYIGPDLGNWNTPNNWVVGDPPFMGVPDVAFNEAALVNNGNTVVLNAAAASNVGGVKLGVSGQTPATPPEIGGLRIETNGVLNSVTGAAGENGSIQVGGGTGTGTLTMLGNSMLTGASLSLGGAAGSSISLSDTANLTVNGTANLQRTTTLSGPSVNFNATSNLSLGNTSVLVADIRSGTAHSALKTDATASVNGTFKPMFTGVTPAVGNRWALIDAATAINGNFASVDLSMAPALPVGQAYSVLPRAAGGRQLLELNVEEVLVLNVNRTSGTVSISNPGGQIKEIDGYSILSPHGSLTGTWNSLDDQNVAGTSGPAWVEAAPTANDLNELYPQAGGTAVNSGMTLGLGSPYVKTFPAFGVDPDDLTFEYHTPAGRTIQGQVVYSGVKTFNNFVLNVDPATGAVAFRNDSPFNIPIDGYAIYSASGSLASGSWNSLDDQNIEDWQQAPPAPSDSAVAELKADGVTTFNEGSGFSLGNLFKTVGATQDLRFEFLMQGEDVPAIGTVIYGAFTPPPPPTSGPLTGDFSGNNSVENADLTLLLDNWGQPVPPVPAGWVGHQPTAPAIDNDELTALLDNWGASQGGGSLAAAGVPEPGSALLLILAAVAALQFRGARR